MKTIENESAARVKHLNDLPMIFIVGNSRSGTTMMGRILGNNPNVFTFHELHFFEQLWSKSDSDRILSKQKAKKLFLQLMKRQNNGYISNTLYSGNINNIANKYINNCLLTEIYTNFLFYITEENGKSIPCEQTPRYVFFIREILKFFPEAKIINMIRDPRDVLLSQKRKWKRKFFLGAKGFPLYEAIRMWANYHPVFISKLWKASLTAADKYSTSERVFFLRFEDLIECPEKYIQDICNFIGILYSSDMLKVPQVGSSNFINQPDKKGINKDVTGKWQTGGLNSAEIYLCQKITGASMAKHGYGAIPVKPSLFLLFYYKLTLPIKLALAFMLNLKRIKNIKEAIKRRLDIDNS
ncbi:MAG: sulfotransferase [Candidatus Kuenenia sp.]|nr:sulfotransferase [Candidatus Kuenenia hertensis]